jgi:pimeloyl-ACP methyl ester carboxylesterase
MQQRLVNVGDGIRLMLHSAGSGVPPVICLSCAGGAHEEWPDVATRLSTITRVLTYGRPGLCGSDPLPDRLAGRQQSIRWVATQLRTLLQNAGVAAPYVLLASSVGSWIADQYAAVWSVEVGGVVLVDPTMASAWPQLGWEPPVIDGEDDDPGCCRFDRDDSFAELARSAWIHR